MATPNKRLDVVRKLEAKRYLYKLYNFSPLLSCTKSPYHRVCSKLINSEPIKDGDGIIYIYIFIKYRYCSNKQMCNNNSKL